MISKKDVRETDGLVLNRVKDKYKVWVLNMMEKAERTEWQQ